MLSDLLRRVLGIALANPGAAKEMADTLDLAGNGPTLSVSAAVIAFTSTGAVAAAGTTNANGTVLTFANNVVSGADGTKGVVLPATPVVGQEVTVLNTNGSSALKVYADASGTGGTVNGGSANSSASLAASKGATYLCTSITGANAWWSLAN